MFGLIRLVIACLIAFVAGVMFERHNQSEACAQDGGTWTSAAYCVRGE